MKELIFVYFIGIKASNLLMVTRFERANVSTNIYSPSSTKKHRGTTVLNSEGRNHDFVLVRAISTFSWKRH